MKKLGLILISILLSIVFIQMLLFSEPDIILGCGLFAFIGSKSSQFNWMSFNILGVYNDTRGRDACGRVINNTVEKGIKKLSDYEDLVQEVSNPEDSITKIVLGHTRKASVGNTGIDNAQPIIFKKSSAIIQRMAKRDKKYRNWLKSLKHNSIVFAGVHNGTIHNYKELAKKYNISLITGKGDMKTDSYILFEILVQGHFEVLTKYNGTAALIFHNYYENNVYVFKGESPYSQNGSNFEEKPLFLWKQPKGGYYFSSIKKPLKIIGGRSKEIVDIATNTLLKFKNGIPIDKQLINRKNSCQKEVTSKYNWKNNYYHPKSYNSYSSINDHTTKKRLNSEDMYPVFFPSTTKKEWQDEIVYGNYLDHYDTIRLTYLKGRYWVKDSLAQGLIISDEYGCIKLTYEELDALNAVNYFLDGLLMNNKADFFSALAIRLKSNFPEKSNTIQQLIHLSKYPSCAIDKKEVHYEDCYTNKKNNGIYYSGVITPMYSKRRYIFKGGNLEIIEECESIEKSTLLLSKEQTTHLMNIYKQDFKRLLNNEIALTKCKDSDSVNHELITIMKGKAIQHYLVTDTIINTQEKTQFPELDNVLLRHTLILQGKDIKKKLKVLNDFNPCKACEYQYEGKQCINCPVIGEYLKLWKEFVPSESYDVNLTTEDDGETEKQMAEEAVAGLTDKLLETVEDLEDELSILGISDVTAELTDVLNGVRNNLINMKY